MRSRTIHGLLAIVLLAMMLPTAVADTQASAPIGVKAELQERRVWVFADPAPTVTFDNQFS
ncbi:MAG: hypothetical protein ACOYMO_07995, partial [Phycisphaerales bacterium]